MCACVRVLASRVRAGGYVRVCVLEGGRACVRAYMCSLPGISYIVNQATLFRKQTSSFVMKLVA